MNPQMDAQFEEELDKSLRGSDDDSKKKTGVASIG
jgi:hypothetical protein